MANVANITITIGRLAKDPVIFENAGGKDIRLTVMASHNFKSKDGSRGADAIEYRRFVPAGSEFKAAGFLHKGDLVAVQGTLRNDYWTGKDGAKHYDTYARLEGLTMLEPKSVTAKRAAGKLVAEPAPEASFAE